MCVWRILCPAALSAGLALVLFGHLESVLAASLAMSLAAWSIGMLDTAQNAVYLDLAPQNAASLVSLGNSIAWHLSATQKICYKRYIMFYS